MKLRVGRKDIISHFNCPYCGSQLTEGSYILTPTGMIQCHNNDTESDIFQIQCLEEFSITYCDGCKKVMRTQDTRFITRYPMGHGNVRCHVCSNGKLSSEIYRYIPKTNQVIINGDGKIIIKQPEEQSENIMQSLIREWDKSTFTVDMIGQGKSHTEQFTSIPKSFWKSDIPLEGYDEVLSEAFCGRCSVDLKPLPDNSLIEGYSHYCPNCGVYFKVYQAHQSAAQETLVD